MGRRGFAIWGMIILAVVAAGVFFLTQKSANTAPAPLEEKQEQDQLGLQEPNDEGVSEDVTVTYADSGYSPVTIKIKKGTTVNFVNNSSRSMWTASNPHPVHTDHSDFDPRKGFERGESYSYTFNDSGTYNYHNHLSPSHRGSVEVE